MDTVETDGTGGGQKLSPETIAKAFTALDRTLTRRGLSYALYVVGGTALLLRGIITRPTVDVDVVLSLDVQTHELAEIGITPQLKIAAETVSVALDLPRNWLNDGPADLARLGLPEGWFERSTKLTYGPSLTIFLAGTEDLIAYKLYATADRYPFQDRHFKDLKALKPTDNQLVSAAHWIVQQDPSPGFLTELLIPTLQSLGVNTNALDL